MLTIESFTKVDNDVNGNPRYVLHFLTLSSDYSEAVSLAKKFGGKQYKAKWYGGGIVFTTYSLEDLIDRINSALFNSKGN